MLLRALAWCKGIVLLLLPLLLLLLLLLQLLQLLVLAYVRLWPRGGRDPNPNPNPDPTLNSTITLLLYGTRLYDDGCGVGGAHAPLLDCGVCQVKGPG